MYVGLGQSSPALPFGFGFRALSKERIKNSDFRRQRFNQMIAPIIGRIISERGRCSILDIGGVEVYWNSFISDPRIAVTLVNTRPDPVSDPQRFASLTADARDLSRFGDHSFDFVHSNSTIEHVGRWGDMKAVAHEIRRLGRVYYVQTPNFWFPVDPHSRTPLLHFFPANIRHRLHSRFRLGWYDRAADLDESMSYVEDAVMLDARQMQMLFPDARLVRERFYGLTKSLIAIGGTSADV
jgi:hypothetical protein